jgi:hypothetical protein
MTAFWDIAPCNLIEVDRRFRGAYCLHHHGDHRLFQLLRDYTAQIPQDCQLHTRRRENLKSHKIIDTLLNTSLHVRYVLTNSRVMVNDELKGFRRKRSWSI